MISWTVAQEASVSMGFPRQEYWSGLLFPSQGALPNPGIESRSSALQADSLPSEPPGKLYEWTAGAHLSLPKLCGNEALP